MKKLFSTILHHGAGIKRDEEIKDVLTVPTIKLEDVLTVHPTELNIQVELNKEYLSCDIQLTNKTDLLVAYRFWYSKRGLLVVSPDQDKYVGTILPRSTSSLTLITVKLGKESTPLKKSPPEENERIQIWAFVVKNGVKAEDITSENLERLTDKRLGVFFIPVVYYFTVPSAANSSSSSVVPEENEKRISLLNDDNNLFVITNEMSDNIKLPVVDYYTVPPATNSSSAVVPEEKEKGISLVDDDDDNNVLHQSIDDEVHETISGGKGSESSVRREWSNEMSSIVLFSHQEIKFATNGLSDTSKIGQGGYGTVYKGNLQDTDIAIKMLDRNGQQGIDEFLQEMEVLGRMRHPNLVKLIGACIQLRALVYEFLPHGSVEDYLRKNPRILTWQMRTRIVFEICSALTFLHSIKPQPVIHGDLKPANILLDANFICKLADFGLSRFIPEGTTTVAFLDTKPKGTFGYIDPEFMRTGILTPSCDLYSFGVTILRLLTGMDALGIGTKVRSAYKEKSLMTMVDSTAGHWPADVSEYLAYFGLKCCAKKKSPGLMKEIAEDLEEILAGINE